MCQEWRDSFRAFLRDMGLRPENTYLERINNEKGYEPGNCKWATMKEQLANTRRNHTLTLNGITLHISEWSRRLGLSRRTIDDRISKGWPVERVLQVKSTHQNASA